MEEGAAEEPDVEIVGEAGGSKVADEADDEWVEEKTVSDAVQKKVTTLGVLNISGPRSCPEDSPSLKLCACEQLSGMCETRGKNF
jgi:hypothetical protein